eukprot:4950248-Prymnesium_polylepis.1
MRYFRHALIRSQLTPRATRRGGGHTERAAGDTTPNSNASINSNDRERPPSPLLPAQSHSGPLPRARACGAGGLTQGTRRREGGASLVDHTFDRQRAAISCPISGESTGRSSGAAEHTLRLGPVP